METMTISSRAVLTFASILAGQKVRLSIPRARTDKAAEAMREAMQAVIATNAVMTANGRPASVYAAAIESTKRIRIV